MTSVLITGIGSAPAISVVKGLRQQSELEVRIIGTDIHRSFEIAGASLCDAFYRVPKAVETDYISELLRICEDEGVRVLFPIIDIELEVIAAHVNEFKERGIHVWLSDLETILICGDKYHTYRFFSEHQFPTPQSWLPEELEGKGVKLSYPLIVKPRHGLGSLDVFRVEDSLDLKHALRKVKKPVIQKYLEGREFTIDVVADETSRLLSVVPRERIETKAGICYKGRTVRDERLIDYAGKIARALKIKGHCNIQCRVDHGQPIFFEVNPRFSGALPLTLAAGVNSPLILVKLALDRKLEQKYFDFRAGVYMTRYWEEVFCDEYA
jgi:carbamoyl-phosphate synthase large subunit